MKQCITQAHTKDNLADRIVSQLFISGFHGGNEVFVLNLCEILKFVAKLFLNKQSEGGGHNFSGSRQSSENKVINFGVS